MKNIENNCMAMVYKVTILIEIKNTNVWVEINIITYETERNCSYGSVYSNHDAAYHVAKIEVVKILGPINCNPCSYK